MYKGGFGEAGLNDIDHHSSTQLLISSKDIFEFDNGKYTVAMATKDQTIVLVTGGM